MKISVFTISNLFHVRMEQEEKGGSIIYGAGERRNLGIPVGNLEKSPVGRMEEDSHGDKRFVVLLRWIEFVVAK